MIKAPHDAKICYNGLYYKLGRHGRINYWNSTEWCVSNTNEPDIIRRLIAGEDNTENLKRFLLLED